MQSTIRADLEKAHDLLSVTTTDSVTVIRIAVI